MLFNFEDFIKNSLGNHSETVDIIGISEFLNSLEFHYFSEVKLKNKSATQSSIKLVLEMSCNLDLLELLSHFNTGRWGNNRNDIAPIELSLNELNLKNNSQIDIEELTLFLNDTSIVIKRIYENSIATEFNDILMQIAGNYVFMTKGLTQKPYEIFVPIFEDTLESLDSTADAEIKLEKIPKTYTEFWGVYLDKDDEASIFDLQKNAYISGDLDFYLSEED